MNNNEICVYNGSGKTAYVIVDPFLGNVNNLATDVINENKSDVFDEFSATVIAQRKIAKFKIGEEFIYSLSIKIDGVITVNKMVYKVSDGLVEIDKEGKVFTVDRPPITVNHKVKLFLNEEEALCIQNPVRYKSYPCGNVGVGESYGLHWLVGNDSYISNGDSIRIRCVSDNLAGDDNKGRNNLFSSDTGWVFYDKLDDRNIKQFWFIEKTNHPNNSKGNLICNNDVVRFRNKFWNQTGLYFGSRDKWLECKTNANSEFKVLISN